MNAVINMTERVLNYLKTMGPSDIVDILIVAYLIYKLIEIVRRTSLYNLAKGLLLFMATLWMAEIFNLNMISFILRRATELGLIVIVILFQPELRRVLEKLGSSFSTRVGVSADNMSSAIEQTVLACSDMSDSRTGALIIFERNVRLNEIISTGTAINSDVSAELIKNIFFNKAPLHDGALIIRDGKIAAAGCILPVSKNPGISKDLGLRHRAGIGLSEQPDAVVLIVSEETGAISCTMDGTLKRHLKPKTVDQILRKELVRSEDEVKQFRSLKDVIGKLLNRDDKEELNADEKDL